MMRRRLVALVLTLAIAGVSETLAICQVACVSSAADADTAPHHSHHSPAPAPASDASIAIGAHDNPCHEMAMATLTAPSPLRTVAFAILPAAIAIEPSSIVMPARPIAAPGNRSAARPLATPLRL